MAQFYRQQMPAGGWTLQNELDASGTWVQTWAKAERSVTITVGPSEGAAYIVVTGL